MGLLSWLRGDRTDGVERSSLTPGLDPYRLWGSPFPWDSAGNPIVTTWNTTPNKEITNDLPAYMAALKECPPAFAAELVRATTLSQARFTFRSLRDRSLMGANEQDRRRNTELRILEQPWPNGNTADLINRMEWHAGVAGSAFVYRDTDGDGDPTRLRLLRPDWMAIVHGSPTAPRWPGLALDSELLGYMYTVGGPNSGQDPVFLLPGEVAHWAPIPDPEWAATGISWLTPAIREMASDIAATKHKVAFFNNAATPNLVVKGLAAPTQEKMDELVDKMDARHAGVRGAYRTIYLTGGADATVVGSSLREMDFSQTQGHGETRISLLSRVPAVMLGISEGLSGSSLNEGNFGQARRMFADTWIYSTLGNLAQSLSTIVTVPAGYELWYDTADMPVLREDERDAADIFFVDVQAITQLVREGFVPDSAVTANAARDVTLLKHTGLVSVQMQAPGTWHGVADAPPGPMPMNEAAAAGPETASKAPPAEVASPAHPAPRSEPVVVHVHNNYEIDASVAEGAIRAQIAQPDPEKDIVRTFVRDEDGELLRIVETRVDDPETVIRVRNVERDEAGDIVAVHDE